MKFIKKLYRPVGVKELQLIKESGFTSFPPRLAWQPIFYPVLNLSYAIRIAKGWNMEDEFSGFAGFVTAFNLDWKYFKKFEVQLVGDEECQELWVPSKELEEFNRHIEGKIEVVAAFYGSRFDNSSLKEEVDLLVQESISKAENALNRSINL